jgi:hypothetical protein
MSPVTLTVVSHYTTYYSYAYKNPFAGAHNTPSFAQAASMFKPGVAVGEESSFSSMGAKHPV